MFVAEVLRNFSRRLSLQSNSVRVLGVLRELRDPLVSMSISEMLPPGIVTLEYLPSRYTHDKYTRQVHTSTIHTTHATGIPCMRVVFWCGVSREGFPEWRIDAHVCGHMCPYISIISYIYDV